MGQRSDSCACCGEPFHCGIEDPEGCWCASLEPLSEGAIAWTPCTSITLGAILTQAAISSSAAHGALLLAFYSAGLAIPFLLIAVAFERMTAAVAVVKRHFPTIIALGGAVMIALGLLILTGEFTVLNAKANELTTSLGLPSTSI